MTKSNEKKPTAKQVILEVEGIEYTLEYSRDSLKRMEAKGFSINELDKKVLTSMDLLVEGALWKNHKTLSQERLNEIVEGIYSDYDIGPLTQALMEMFTLAVPDFGNTRGTEKKVFKIVR